LATTVDAITIDPSLSLFSVKRSGTSSSPRKRSTTRRKHLKRRPLLLLQKMLVKSLKPLKLMRSELGLLSAEMSVKTESASV
jgi:hypothetical protein